MCDYLSDTESENDNNEINVTEQEIRWKEREELKGVDEYLLKVHGREPGRKVEGVTRLLYENRNGLNNRLCWEQEAKQSKADIR